DGCRGASARPQPGLRSVSFRPSIRNSGRRPQLERDAAARRRPRRLRCRLRLRSRWAPTLTSPACGGGNGTGPRAKEDAMDESVSPRNHMKQKLAAGELVLCMNLRLARTVDIAMVAKAGGYDALYVDMEHSPYSIDTA